MKVFITGATGFIGKNLVKELNYLGIEITVNLYKDEESPFSTDVKTYKLDETEAERDIKFLSEGSFDGIVHLASLFLSSHSPHEVVKLIDSNVRFSSYILECSCKAGVRWFINTGTYWQNYKNAYYSPVNLYAATKQAFESIAQYYIETDQIKFITLRLCDTFGPNDLRPKIFNHWLRIAKTGERLDMSPGDQIIDVTYIDDVVSAYIILANLLNDNNSEVKSGDVYGVQADKRYSLKELANIFQNVTGFRINIDWGARPYRSREVMIPWEDAKVVPGWKSKTTIEEGIKKICL